jgi:hypothetical protein
VAAEAVAGPRGEGADAEGAVGDVAVDGVAARRRDAHPVRPAAAGAHGAHLEPPHQPTPTPPGPREAAAVHERLLQPRRPRRLRRIAAPAAAAAVNLLVQSGQEGKKWSVLPTTTNEREGGVRRTCC